MQRVSDSPRERHGLRGASARATLAGGGAWLRKDVRARSTIEVVRGELKERTERGPSGDELARALPPNPHRDANPPDAFQRSKCGRLDSTRLD